MLTLKERGVRGDLIQVYKRMKRLNNGNINNLALMVKEADRTRRNGFLK